MKYLNGQDLKKILISGANNLYNHYPEVDRLNVFPVPDGDTGINMNLTLTTGSTAIANRNDENIYNIARAFATGLVMGSRGNSGVITSQIFSGFANGLSGKEKIGVKGFVEAWEEAKKIAYKAVNNPVEGTILTVIRESSDDLAKHFETKKDMSIEEAMDYLFKAAKKSLKHTPELLPVLKEVGVVDSGGAGLCFVMEGMLKAMKGKFVERSDMNDAVAKDDSMTSFLKNGEGYAGAKLSEGEEGYGYCTQFLLRLGKPEEGKRPFVDKKFETFLASHGNSVVLVHDGDIVKVHVHTLSPGNMLNYAQNYGEFLSITIENMSEEHDNISNGHAAMDMESNIERKREKEWSENAIIVVSSGSGLDEVFKELGATSIVSGGQTMNPSTEDFTKAIEQVHAHNVYIFPNNSNIVMAANQAAELLSNEEQKIRVVPTNTIPEGIASMMQFAEDGDREEAFEAMKDAISTVKSGSVTFATRDTDIDGVHVTKDQYLAMTGKHNIVSCVPDKKQALKDVLDSLVDEDSSMITIFAGEDVKDEEIDDIAGGLTEKYPLVDIDVRRGNQPVYSFLLGIE